MGLLTDITGNGQSIGGQGGLLSRITSNTVADTPITQTTAKTPKEAAKDLLQAKLAEIRAKSADTGKARSLVSAVANNKQKANAVRDAEVNTSRARKQLEDLLLPQTLGNLDQKEVAKATIREATKDLVDRTKDRGVWGFSSNESGLFGKDDKELNKRVSNEQEGIYNLLKDRDDPLAEAYKRNVRREATEDWAQDIVEAHNSDSALSNFGLGFQGGAEQFIGGVRQLFNKDAVEDGAYTLAAQQIAPELQGSQRVAFQIGNGVGFMALPLVGSGIIGAAAAAAGVPLAISTIGGQATSAGVFGSAAAGNTYKETLNDGHTATDARTYAAINGTLEGTLQFLLGGIAGLGGVGAKALGKAVAGTKIGTSTLTKINNVSTALAKNPGLQKVFRGLETAGVYSSRSASEAVEEWMQAVADPVVRNIVLDENNEIKPFSEDKLYAGMLGALTSGLLNVGTVRSTWNSTRPRETTETVAAPVTEPAAEPIAEPTETNYFVNSEGQAAPNVAGLLPAAQSQSPNYNEFVEQLRQNLGTRNQYGVDTYAQMNPRTEETPAPPQGRNIAEIYADLAQNETDRQQALDTMRQILNAEMPGTVQAPQNTAQPLPQGRSITDIYADMEATDGNNRQEDLLWTTPKQNDGWKSVYFGDIPILDALKLVDSRYVSEMEKETSNEGRGNFPFTDAYIAAWEDVRQGTISPMAAAHLLADAYRSGGVNAVRSLSNENTGNLTKNALSKAMEFDASHVKQNGINQGGTVALDNNRQAELEAEAAEAFNAYAAANAATAQREAAEREAKQTTERERPAQIAGTLRDVDIFYDRVRAALEADAADAFAAYAEANNETAANATRQERRRTRQAEQRLRELFMSRAQGNGTLQDAIEARQQAARDAAEEAFLGRFNSDSPETTARIEAFRAQQRGEIPTSNEAPSAPAGIPSAPSNTPTGVPNTPRRTTFNVPEGNGRVVDSETGTINMQKAAELGTLPSEVAEAFKNATHATVGTEQNIAAAQQAINKVGVENAVIHLERKANGKRGLNSTETMAGLMLIQDLAKTDSNRAIELGEAMIQAASDTARALSIYKMMKRSLPGGLVRLVEGTISSRIEGKIKTDLLTEQDKADVAILDELSRAQSIDDVDLTNASEDIQKWFAQLRKVNEDIANKNALREKAGKTATRQEISLEDAAVGKALAIVESKRHTSGREKIRGLQRIALLTNPKTHVRNITGNTLFAAGDILASPISSLADLAISKATGQRSYAGLGLALQDRAAGFVQGMQEAIDEYKLGIESGDKYNENGTFGPKAKAFTGNNALGKLGNRIDGLVGLLLEIPDRAAIKAQYNSVLNQLIKSNPEAVQANEGLPTPEMVDTALWSALNITFRDDNRVTEAMQTVRNGLNIAGDIIAPFVKTPTNVVMRGLEFTPVAWGEALYKGLIGPNSMRALKKEGESTLRIQREIAQLIGRGAVGTALILAGTVLRQAGLGTGGDEEEVAKEQGWRQVTGEQPNSIKIGNHYYDISSIPPLSIPLLAGMALKGGISWGNFFSAIGGLANSATEMPVLQGVKELLGGGYGQKGAGEVAATLVGNLSTQVIPFISLSRQVANLTDPYVRTTSADGTGIEKIAGQTVNKIKNSIPGLRQTLPVKPDSLGNAIENYPAETALGRAANIFFNPLNMSLENTDPVVKEIDDIYKKTGSTSVLPPTAPTGTFNINNESYKLTVRERQEWQQTAGQFIAKTAQDLFKTPEWRNASLEDQQKMMAKVYTMANMESKGDYAEDHNLNYTPDEKSGTQYDTLRSQGLSAGVALGILTHKDGTAETAGYIYDHISDQSQREAALAAVGVTAKAWQKGYQIYSPYMSTVDFNTAYIIARKSGIKKEEAIAELRNAGVGLTSYNQAARFYKAVHD